MELEKERLIEGIKNTNNEALVKKIAKLLEKESQNSFWLATTAELRAELQKDETANRVELDDLNGIERLKAFKKMKKQQQAVLSADK
ncbi:MAG: hypothetical protein M0D57_18150 [Sphingobacteriales bacterium JAD_PAG50586_3]|nr:MAG: hypothetical protein M0D57_18150 [Sphingobacteriales bacterium JAD_PAG50586_3]